MVEETEAQRDEVSYLWPHGQSDNLDPNTDFIFLLVYHTALQDIWLANNNIKDKYMSLGASVMSVCAQKVLRKG